MFAVIVHSPTFFALITPLLLTVAIALLLELQVIVSYSEDSLGYTVVIKVNLPFFLMVNLELFNFTFVG